MISIHDKPLIVQDHDSWLIDSQGSDPISIANVGISDGSLLNVEITHTPGNVTLSNVWNMAATGKYFVLLWPFGNDTVQSMVPNFLWDQSACTHDVLQGPNEALARFKCHKAVISGGRYRAFLNADGRPNKQILQFRHGDNFLVQGATFIDGWNDHGQQKLAGSGYVTSQHVGQVTYDSCHFGRWTPGHKLWDRQPGVDRIILAGKCLDPDGKLLKNGERFS
jgi:hypothetical protein